MISWLLKKIGKAPSPTETDDVEIRRLTAEAVRRARAELQTSCGGSHLFGFALCTDDDLMTLYHVYCTDEWVRAREKDDPDIGYISNEWLCCANEELFDRISDRLAQLSWREYPTDSESADARYRRFNALVLALEDCRDAGLFDADTLLCVVSTDPSEDLQALAMNAVDRLNSPAVADRFAKVFGYEKYRGT